MLLLTLGPILTCELGLGVNSLLGGDSSLGPISTCRLGLGVSSSTSYFLSKLRNHWLYNIGASEYISNDLFKFTSYTT
ncbi:hypothetical protein PZA11_001280 [Diplocarpon coronariae]